MGKAEEGFTAQHEPCGVHGIQIQAEGTEFPEEVWQVQRVKVVTMKLSSDMLELTAHAQKTLEVLNEEKARKLKDPIKIGETKMFVDRKIHETPDGPWKGSWHRRRRPLMKHACTKTSSISCRSSKVRGGGEPLQSMKSGSFAFRRSECENHQKTVSGWKRRMTGRCIRL